MMVDVVVVGAGLSGLMAAWLTQQQGAQVMIVARGVGATHVSPGTVDVLGYRPDGQVIGNPGWWFRRAFKTKPRHPYSLAGREALQRGMVALQEMCRIAGYPLMGELRSNTCLPTAIGATHPTCLAPGTMINGRQEDDQKPWALVGFQGWVEFDARYAAANLGSHVRVVEVILPEPCRADSLTSVDVARLFETSAFRERIVDQIKPALSGVERVGFPGVLGWRHAVRVIHDMEQELGVPVFEIPTMPPCVSGMRLFDILHRALHEAGVESIMGPEAKGWMEEGIVRGVITRGASGERRIKAGSVVLATGGLLNGGLVAGHDGAVRESVFDIPVEAPPRGDWYDPLFFGRHPLLEAGVQVNEHMQPMVEEQVLYKGLFAVGGVLAGADRLGEASTQGIDLATATKAAEALTA